MKEFKFVISKKRREKLNICTDALKAVDSIIDDKSKSESFNSPSDVDLIEINIRVVGSSADSQKELWNWKGWPKN